MALSGQVWYMVITSDVVLCYNQRGPGPRLSLLGHEHLDGKDAIPIHGVTQ